MVAISLYKGNLHRVPDVPRRWAMPQPRISVKEFRGLLRRRSKALSLLKVGEAAASTSVPSTVCNANPSPPPQSLTPTPPTPPTKQQDRKIKEEDGEPRVCDLNIPVGVDNGGGKTKRDDSTAEEIHQLADFVSLVKVEEGSGDIENLQVEKDEATKNLDPGYSISDKEKRRKEVEERLEILNKRKHNLVQALKQILSLEEELKRRSSMQPKMASEANAGSVK